MLNRSRRQSEHGQTLILALSFLVMFGIVGIAVLQFASAVQRQRTATESTAAIDSVTEGAAQFAMANTGLHGCGTINGSTSMSFASGDTLTYTAGPGACSSSVSTAPGQNCALCVLNYEGIDKPLSVPKGVWTVPAEVDVNGSVSVTSLTSGVPIEVKASGTCSTTCLPSTAHLPNPIVDPLAGAIPIPTPAANPPSVTGGGIQCPGTYNNLKATGSGQILFLSPAGANGCPGPAGPGLFIVTGGFAISGGGSVVASDSTVYLAPSASFRTSGGGAVSLDCGATATSTTCGTPDTPTSGLYAGVAVFVDPTNSPTTAQHGGMSFQGNGNFTVAGTFEASHAQLSLGGNGGTQSFQAGRLIVSQLVGNGNGGASLGFSGGVANTTGCNYWFDAVAGNESSGASQPGHVRFESGCNSGSPTSIISFDYSP